jgi:hypothetical protein
MAKYDTIINALSRKVESGMKALDRIHKRNDFKVNPRYNILFV